MKWTEYTIAAFLSRHIFERKCLVVVPNCSWPGNECDVLAVTMNLRIIDVEVKISRADFRADAAKEKWFHSWDWTKDGSYDPAKRRPRQWPQRVWKHYYCLPAELWTPDLLPPDHVSGVLLIKANDKAFRLTVERRATPCRTADKLTAEDAIDIARLASFRMWDALEEAERQREIAASLRAKLPDSEVWRPGKKCPECGWEHRKGETPGACMNCRAKLAA